jgi:hypothetical protein
MADHLSGQKTVGTDRAGQFGEVFRRLGGELGLAGGKRQHVNRYVGDPPVLQHQGRRSQQRLGAGGVHRTLGREHPEQHQAGDGYWAGETKWRHGLDLLARLT